MRVENARFSFNRFSFRAAAAVGTHEVVDVTSWSQVGSLSSEVSGWDEMVVYGVDDTEIRQLIKEGNPPKGFLDERVVCGGLPRDLPWMLEDVFDDFVQTMSEIFSAPKWVKGAFASTLALAWRDAGYPKLDKDGLLAFASKLYPALSTVVKAPSGAWWAPNPTIRGLEVYRAQPSDAPELGQLLSKNMSPTSTREALKLIDSGVLVIRNFEDRMVAASVLSHRNRVQTRPDNDKILSLVESLVEQAKKQEFEALDDYCYTCATYSARCACPKDGASFTKMIKNNIGHSSSSGEHRWGKAYASRPSIANVISAGALSSEVREKMISWFSENSVAEWENKLTRAVWFDIAVFLEQCHQTVDALKPAGAELMAELVAAQGRVAGIHNYAPTLFKEFEGPTAQLSGKFAEIYLGRDAIFAYHARQAMRSTMRRKTPLGERLEKFAELSEIRYVVVSRTARWINGIHTPRLGGFPSVFIDTGFSGSIPRAIAAEEHLMIADRPGKRSGKVQVQDRVAQVRLMNTGNVGYRFVEQWSTADVHKIEMDAKPTETAHAVDEARPTGALEQLVFRVLRRGIRELAVQETEKMLASTPGFGAIRTYAEAKAFIASQKKVQAAV